MLEITKRSKSQRLAGIPSSALLLANKHQWCYQAQKISLSKNQTTIKLGRQSAVLLKPTTAFKESKQIEGGEASLLGALQDGQLVNGGIPKAT